MTPADPNLAYLYSRVSAMCRSKVVASPASRKAMNGLPKKVGGSTIFITFDDLGLSAFRGKNYKIGALARFLKWPKRVELPGRILVIDEFSRMSRTAIIEANKLFTRLLETGFTIAFTMDRTTYTKKEINGATAASGSWRSLKCRPHMTTPGACAAMSAKHGKPNAKPVPPATHDQLTIAPCGC